MAYFCENCSENLGIEIGQGENCIKKVKNYWPNEQDRNQGFAKGRA